MLHDPARHEPLRALPWDADRARACIAQIVRDTEAHFSEDRYWPLHPLDQEGDAADTVETPLYHGASGVIWALHYLRDAGAATLTRDYTPLLPRLLADNRAWLAAAGIAQERASYLMGDTPIALMACRAQANAEQEALLVDLIAANIDHPARELMWGAPGTLLAALFAHERTGAPRWAELFRRTAAALWAQLEWSPEYACAYWSQNLYGRRSTYLDAVHGFVATAVPLIRGRHLLDPAAWDAWEARIVNTVRRTAELQDGLASWRAQLDGSFAQQKKLMQFCHGAPGFVICLAGLPSVALDDLLLAGAEATWAAGPLAKGANLCHGTGGNGYAFLKMYTRTGDVRWLERARAFAMHGIAQVEEAAAHYGRGRYSLWTGDPGFAIYLWDCLRKVAAFPTLDVFDAAAPAA